MFLHPTPRAAPDSPEKPDRNSPKHSTSKVPELDRAETRQPSGDTTAGGKTRGALDALRGNKKRKGCPNRRGGLFARPPALRPRTLDRSRGIDFFKHTHTHTHGERLKLGKSRCRAMCAMAGGTEGPRAEVNSANREERTEGGRRLRLQGQADSSDRRMQNKRSENQVTSRLVIPTPVRL